MKILYFLKKSLKKNRGAADFFLHTSKKKKIKILNEIGQEANTAQWELVKQSEALKSA